MKHKIFLVISLAVLVLAVGIFSWTLGKGKLSFKAAPIYQNSGVVAGKVIMQDGTAAASAQVLLWKKSDYFAKATTDGVGNYRFPFVPASYQNDYHLSADLGWDDPFNTFASSQNFSIKNKETKTINLVLVSVSGAIRGKVTNKVTGQPISGASVSYYDFKGGGGAADTLTASDGTYNLVRVHSTEDARLLVSAQGYDKTNADYKLAKVVIGQWTEVNFALQPLVQSSPTPTPPPIDI